MAANGLMYSVSFQLQTISNAVQDLFVVQTAAGVPLLIHSIRLEFVPQIVSGVAQDVRAQSLSVVPVKHRMYGTPFCVGRMPL